MKTAGYSAIKKRDFFSIFWKAYQKTFNQKVIGSAWSKTGIWPYNPQIVLDTLPAQPRTPSPSRIAHGPPNPSSLPGYDPPRRRDPIRKIIGSSLAKTDTEASKLFDDYSNRFEIASADLTIKTIDNENLQTSLFREKGQRTRTKRPLEQLRSDEGNGTLLMSPRKIKKAKDIFLMREQEARQKESEKKARKEAVAQKKVDNELELQQKRDARAVAADERKAAAAEKKAVSEVARATREAKKELKRSTKAVNKAPRAKPKKKTVVKKPAIKPARPAPPEPDIQTKTRTGRVIKQSACLRAQK